MDPSSSPIEFKCTVPVVPLTANPTINLSTFATQVKSAVTTALTATSVTDKTPFVIVLPTDAELQPYLQPLADVVPKGIQFFEEQRIVTADEIYKMVGLWDTYKTKIDNTLKVKEGTTTTQSAVNILLLSVMVRLVCLTECLKAYATASKAVNVTNVTIKNKKEGVTFEEFIGLGCTSIQLTPTSFNLEGVTLPSGTMTLDSSGFVVGTEPAPLGGRRAATHSRKQKKRTTGGGNTKSKISR
mgnify:CR=1 FL=1